MLLDDLPAPRLTLRCHPATPAPMVRAIEAHATIRPDGSLAITYRLWGEMAHLRIPAPQLPDRTAALWEHTCFEAFVATANGSAYREFNFSPSGQWAAYAFSDYRRRDESAAPGTPPQITSRRLAGRLELAAIVAPDALPPGAVTLRLGLSAVVEAADAPQMKGPMAQNPLRDTVDGSHSYWALQHPAARPDFHHRAAFTLELAARNSV